MFKKPVKPKAHVKCKSSERKQVLEQISKAFKLSPNEIETYFNFKDLHKMKFIHTMAYVTDTNEPIAMEHEKQWIPTIYFLNHFPNILPTFTCPDEVIPVIQNGADLMLPGVVFPNASPDSYGPNSYGKLEKGALCAINTIRNSTPFAVGHTAKSSFDMFMSARRGVAVNVFHVIGDHLWLMGSQGALTVRDHMPCQMSTSSKEPVVEECSEKVISTEGETITEDFNNLRVSEETVGADEPMHSLEVQDEHNSNPTPEILEENTNGPLPEEALASQVEEKREEDPNEIFMQMFLHALKYSVKDTALPMPINVFYANHILPFCPAGQDVNIKKTKYKKVGTFLTQMAADGLIQLGYNEKRELHDLVAINRNHELYSHTRRILSNPESSSTASGGGDQSASSAVVPEASYGGPPEVQLVFLVRNQHRLLLTSGFRVGDDIPPTELREFVTKYVKELGLLSETKKGFVVPDVGLRELMTSKPPSADGVTWKQLMDGIQSSMPHGYRITFPNGDSILRKSDSQNKKQKVSGPPAVILECQSGGGGNRTVTRIYNLEEFRIQESHFASLVQRGRACSCVTTEDKQNRRCVQCQGDHRDYCTWLLEKIYGLKRDNILGYTEMNKDKSKKIS